MTHKTRAILFPILFLILLALSDTYATDSLEPGMASGKLSVNYHTFYIKHAYAKKTEDNDGKTTYLILLTNRAFPRDLSKLSRFELNRYAVRYEIEGVVIGIDEDQNPLFIDVLRVTGTIVTAEFAPDTKKQGTVQGRIYMKKEIDDLKNRIKFDISFNAKITQ